VPAGGGGSHLTFPRAACVEGRARTTGARPGAPCPASRLASEPAEARLAALGVTGVSSLRGYSACSNRVA
jgi:hypothetical protein